MEDEKNIEKLKNEVLCDIKSLLLASKEGLTENELKSEYYKLLGNPIPYNQLGYRTFGEMLNKSRGLIETKIIYSDEGYLKIYLAKPDLATKDLVQLVKDQLDKNKLLRDQNRLNQIIYNSKRNTQSSKHQSRSIYRFPSPFNYNNNNINNTNYDQYLNNVKSVPNNFNQTSVNMNNNRIPFMNGNNINLSNFNQIDQNYENNIPNTNTNSLPYMNNYNISNMNVSNPYMQHIPYSNCDNNSFVNNNIPNVNNELVMQYFQNIQQLAHKRTKSLGPLHPIQQNIYPYYNQMGYLDKSVSHSNTSKKLNSLTNTFQTAPDFIKTQIEAIVNDAPGNKIKASDLFKEYARRYNKLIISDSYNFPSFKDLVLSFGNLFSIEQLPDSYEYYVSKYVPPKIETKTKNLLDENNNIQTMSPIVNITLDDFENFTEINNYEEIKNSTEIQTKKISIKGQDVVYDFNLILMRDGEVKKIFIHWLQVANLFEIKPKAFKRNFLTNSKYLLNKCVKKYKMNENNKILFDFVEARLNITLKDYEDIEETTFFLKDSLNEACDYIFNKNNSQVLKELIKKI